MLTPADFGLTNNPFHLLVTEASERHWAGMPDVKKRLADIVHSVLPDDIGASEFVVLHGDLGGGKTHALRYFAREIRDEGYGRAFYAGKSRIGAKLSFVDLFRSVVEESEDGFFDDLAKKVANAVRREALLDNADDNKEAEIIRQVSAQNRKMVNAFLECHAKSGAAKSHLLKVKDDYAAAAMMASLFGVMTTPIGKQEPPYKAVYFFVDEMEDTLDAKPAEFASFMSACRELINRVGENFAFILAFSAEAALLEAQIPDALRERMTRPYVELKQLSDANAREFMEKFLQTMRVDGFQAPQPFYPFSDGAANVIVERESSPVPRHIIMGMRRVFERARDRMDKPGEISAEMATEILDEMGV